MISMLSTIQRLKNQDSGDTIAACIANEDEVLKAMITIMGGLSLDSLILRTESSYLVDFRYVGYCWKDAGKQPQVHLKIE